jgi:hypothetical protein
LDVPGWPDGFPTAAGALIFSFEARELAFLDVLETPLEPLDLARGIDQALLTREERVALRADIDVQILLRRAGLP